MMKSILQFKGEFEFLNNFYTSPFVWNGFCWPTIEHAYQAEKCVSPDLQNMIRIAKTSAIAKGLEEQLNFEKIGNK